MAEDIASLAIRIDSLEARNAERDLRNLEGQGRRTARSTDVMGAAFRSLGVALAGVSFAALSRDMLRTIEQVQNMDIRLKGLTKSASDYVSVQADLSRISEQHHKNIITLSEAYAGLLSIEKTGVIVRQQSLAILEGMSNAQSKTGATTEALKQSALGLNQALSMGVVQWEEIKQVTEPIPGLLNNIANAAGYTGKTAIGAFKQVVSEGKVTSDLFGRIMVESLQQYQGAAEAAGKTLTATYADISNAWTELATVIESPVADVITPVLNAIGGAISGLSQDLRELKALKDSVLNSASFSGINKMLSAIPDISARPTKNEGGATGEWGDSSGATASWGDTKKEAQAIRKEIEATEGSIKKAAGTHHAAAGHHRAASKSIATGLSEEQKAAQELARSYENLDVSLKKQLYLSRIATEESHNASLEYDLAEGSLQKLTDAKKLYLLQMAQEIQNNAITAKETEAKKSEMDSLIDKYNQLTLSASEYYRTKLEGEGIKGAAQEPLVKQFEKNSATETNIANFEKSSEALQKYAADIDNAEQSMAGLGATTNDVFAAANGGISQVIGAFDAMIKSLDGNSKALDDLAKKKAAVEKIQPSMDKDKYLKDIETKAKLTEQYAKKEQALNNETVNLYLDGFNNVIGAAAAMYQDNEAAQIAAQSIMLVTLGIQAVMAVVNQASQGDVYTAFARMAAMATAVGSLVASVGGTSSGGSVPPAPPNSADTGTVLGDKTAQSNSVGNVYDLLKNIHAEEYTELRGINKGVAALSGGILGAVTKTFQTGAITGTSAPHLGQSKYTLVSGGIATGSVSLTDLLRGNADIAGQMFTTELLMGGSKKKPTFSFQDYFTPMADSVTKSLQGMFMGIAETMQGVSSQLGKDIGKDLDNKLKNAILPELKIDILGLSGEEAVKKVNAVVSTAMDNVATQVFGEIISQYQRLGEGMLETAVRIVAEMAVVKDALSQSGLAMSGNAIDLSDSLVQAAGGLEEFQKQFEGFYDAFFSDIEKQERLQKRLNETFAEVYLLLPKTREEYKKTLESLNLSNKLDQDRYSLLLQLSSAADSYYSMIESKSNASAENNSAMKDQEIQLLRLMGKETEAVSIERERELNAMDESLRSMQKLIYTYTDLSNTLEVAYNNAADLITKTFTTFFNLAKSLSKYSNDLKTGNLSTGSPESIYLANKAAFERITGIISGGKGTTAESAQQFIDALNNLQSVSDDFLKSSKDYNASGKGYTSDFKAVMQALNGGVNKSEKLVDNAEKQLNALNAAVKGMDDLNISVINVDGSISKVNDSTQDVKSAIDDVYSAVKGMTAAIISINKLQADRDAAALAVQQAEGKAASDRAEAEKVLKGKQDAALVQKKQSAYNSLYGKTDLNAMDWLAKNNGIDNKYASGWSAWGLGMLGTFDPTLDFRKFTDLANTMDDFRRFLIASGKGLPYPHDGAYYAAEFARIKSHANGLGFVPYDNYMARLHQGEKVVTAFDARKNETEMKQIYNDILTELKIANRQRAAGNTEMIKKTDKLIDSNEAQTRSIRRIAV